MARIGIDVACMTRSRLLLRGGYSPIQRVIGYTVTPHGCQVDYFLEVPTTMFSKDVS